MIALPLAAVLWDLDGTLIDSEPMWVQAQRAMLARFGLELPAGTQQQLIGSGLSEAAERFRSLGVPMAAPDIIAEWVAGVADRFAAQQPVWRPGAKQLLASLRAADIPCALVTMSVRSLAEQVVRMLPPNTFQVLVTADEVAHSKPHPEPYLRAAAHLGVPITQCLAFEDSPTGLRSAYASGALTIGVPNLVPLEGAPAHVLLATLEHLDAAQLQMQYAALREADAADRSGEPADAEVTR